VSLIFGIAASQQIQNPSAIRARRQIETGPNGVEGERKLNEKAGTYVAA
jgi:hypothetical protein